MRKISILLLTLVMLVAGVGAANAEKVYADLSQYGDKWDGTDVSFEWSAPWGNQLGPNLDAIGLPKGDLRKWEKLVVVVDELNNCDFFRVLVYSGDDSDHSNTFICDKTGVNEFTLEGNVDFLNNVTRICLSGSNNSDTQSSSWSEETPASFKVKEVYLEYQSTKTLAADLSAITDIDGNASWAAETNTFGWTATSWNSIQLFGSGNYSAYTTLNLVTTAGTADHFRVILKFTNGTAQVTINPVAAGTVSINLADYTTAGDLANVQTIRLSGANDVTGDVTVSSVYLEGPNVSYIEATAAVEAPAGTTDVKDLTGTNTGWASTVVYPKEFAVQGQAFGDGDGSNEATHVDIDGYDYICFNVTTATDNSAGLRVWIWDDATSSVKTLYAYPIADYKKADFEAAVKITGVGTYVAKVSGYKYLKGVKAANDWGAPAAVVSMAYMCKGNPVEYAPTGKYILVGEATGSYTLADALNDDDATCYDATGVTGTDVDLTSVANPNALFIAKGADVLANTENVIVNDVCDNLFLTDGFAFKAPADFTAAHVSYKRALAGKTVTVCLPFALNSDQVANIGTFYALSNFDGSTLQFTSVDATEANTPYVVVASSYSLGLDGADVAVPATPASLAASASNVEFIGTMAETTVPASDATYSYYAYNNGEFVKVVDAAATLPAFRGYFKVANGGAGSRALNVSFEDAATGIETLSTVENETKSNTIFDLSGRRVNAAQKGVYIVNGKKVIK